MESRLFLLIFFVSACPTVFALARLDPKLKATLETQQHANIFITMKDRFDTATFSTRSFATRADRIATLRDSLIQFAGTSQKSVLDEIQIVSTATSHSFQTQSFWISNQVYVKDADSELVKLLLLRDDVESIEEEVIHHLDDPIKSAPESEVKDANILAEEWNIEKVRAPSVWTMANGTRGAGVVVGVIDTGARHTHTMLRGNYADDGFSWFDAVNDRLTPYDDEGHGSHVTGSAVGSGGYGVAPGAKWISCKSFNSRGEASSSDTLECFQFMLCPTNPFGNVTDCRKTPRIVNNSWSSQVVTTIYNAAIENWHAAGIIPVFAQGNTGPGCTTGGSPANGNVIAVGATTDSDALAGFSSRGPTTTGAVKPDISAPGQDIRSAGHTSDTERVINHGTSMASPHVAGVIALLLSYKPNLSYRGVKDILEQSAAHGLTFSGTTCGGIRDNVFPNNHFGHGRIDALSAVRYSDGYVEPGGNGAQAPAFTSALVVLAMGAVIITKFIT